MKTSGLGGIEESFQLQPGEFVNKVAVSMNNEGVATFISSFQLFTTRGRSSKESLVTSTRPLLLLKIMSLVVCIGQSGITITKETSG